MNALPLYVSPVPAVVVAPLYTFPFASTLSSPLVRVGNHRVLEIVANVVVELSNCAVDDADSDVPVAPKCICVVVELATWLKKPEALGVYGNANVDVKNPASLLNQDSLIDDEAIVLTNPLLPVYAKPCDSEGSVSVPTLAVVADAYVNDPRVVDELENVLRAVNVLAVYVLGIVVDAAMYELIALF